MCPSWPRGAAGRNAILSTPVCLLLILPTQQRWSYLGMCTPRHGDCCPVSPASQKNISDQHRQQQRTQPCRSQSGGNMPGAATGQGSWGRGREARTLQEVVTQELRDARCEGHCRKHLPRRWA